MLVCIVILHEHKYNNARMTFIAEMSNDGMIDTLQKWRIDVLQNVIKNEEHSFNYIGSEFKAGNIEIDGKRIFQFNQVINLDIPSKLKLLLQNYLENDSDNKSANYRIFLEKDLKNESIVTIVIGNLNISIYDNNESAKKAHNHETHTDDLVQKENVNVYTVESTFGSF